MQAPPITSSVVDTMELLRPSLLLIGQYYITLMSHDIICTTHISAAID